MKTEKAINQQKESRNEKKHQKNQDLPRAKKSLAHNRQFSVADEKHLLKHRIIKALKKRGTIQLDKLVMKLDARPTQVLKILKKLESKGIVRQTSKSPGLERGEHHHRVSKRSKIHQGHHLLEGEGDPHRQCEKRHHRTKATGKPRSHHHEHGRRGKDRGSLQFALNS